MTIRKEIESSLVLVLFGLVFLLYTTRYPLGTWASPGPGVFPLIVGGVLTSLALWQLIQALIKRKRPGDGEATGGRKSLRGYLQRNPGEARVISLVAIFILNLFLIKVIGFFVANFFFIIAASRLTVAGDWKRPLVLAVALSLFCYLLFEVWLKLSLPRGIIF